MSDDQGWGDVGYNGHPILKTPNLDAMAQEGIRFDRFYAAAPVCSPTRGSCLTGRHPFRYGVFWANIGRLPREEITLAEALKQQGYKTGHFGKWHLGSLTQTVKDGIKGGPKNLEEYSPPWENGFDVCFSNELGGPTYNPTVWCKGEYRTNTYRYFMDRPVEEGEDIDTPGCYEWPSAFWLGPGQKATENLAGDSSEIIMDRAIHFIDQESKAANPFLAIVWFYSPHSPIAASDKHREPYKNLSIEEQHWYGCLTAMDEQIGRLRSRLKDLGIADNTMLWFCSDNGPSWIHDYNSAGPFRGKKGTLYEGGVRVPATLMWPAKIKRPHTIDAPCCTSDIYSTIQAIVGFRVKNQPDPSDGVNLMPMIEGRATKRQSPIGFQTIGHDDVPLKSQCALIDNRYKILREEDGPYRLYDLKEDPGETRDLAKEKPLMAEEMRRTLERWIQSCKNSNEGKDYR